MQSLALHPDQNICEQYKLIKVINFIVFIKEINNGGERNEKEISNENIERLKEDTAENFISAVSF